MTRASASVSYIALSFVHKEEIVKNIIYVSDECNAGYPRDNYPWEKMKWRWKKKRADEERLSRSRATTNMADRAYTGRFVALQPRDISEKRNITVYLNSDPVLPIMPVNGPFALVARIEPRHGAVRSIRCFWDTRYTDDTKQIAFSY